MPKLKLVKVTLCCPSDVTEEVKIATHIINEWNRINAEIRGLTIKCRHWLSDSYPDALKTGQGAVNEQIIDDAHILIAIFWSRLGSPTETAQSGTVEEIRRGIKLGRTVLVYFSNLEPLPANADSQQVEGLWNFRQELQARHSCWSFQSRSQFRELFTNHFALALNALTLGRSNKSSLAKTRRNVSQISKGNGNTQIIGDGNEVNYYEHPPTVKNIIERRSDAITPEEEYQVDRWIKELAEGTVGKTRKDAFAEWGSRLLNRFKVANRQALRSTQMEDVETWYRQQRAIQKQGYKTKAPDEWRAVRVRAIKSAMRDMRTDNETYYPDVARRLKMKKPFISLTKLTKADLDRVYRMALRDNNVHCR